ncbi:MAG: YggT family protein [Pyrinomonadaceae bacterium]
MDNKLEIDEARRATQHEMAKAQIEADVNQEIVARADVSSPREQARVDDLAQDFRGKAVDEIAETEREVERGRTVARISQFVDYVFYLIYSLFLIRLVLNLLAANSKNGFVQFINAITNPMYAPFRGITNSPSTSEGNTLALPIVIAIIAYLLLHLAINGLLRLLAHRKTEV